MGCLVVSRRALVQRINRKLQARGLCLQGSRGKHAGETYFLTDGNSIVEHAVDVAQLGTKLGLLRSWEALDVDPAAPPPDVRPMTPPAPSKGANGRSRYRRGVVYLINAHGTSLYKIGWAVDAEKRKGQLQIGSALPLVLVRQWPGVLRDEMATHRALEAYRQAGEWFHFNSIVDAVQLLEAALRQCQLPIEVQQQEAIARLKWGT